MSETNRHIFLENETSGAIVDTITQATVDSTLYSREILEDYDPVNGDKTLLVDCADDDTSTPTIQVKVSQKIGESWTDYEEIEAASQVPKQILISFYDSSVMRKNNGVKFEFTKNICLFVSDI